MIVFKKVERAINEVKANLTLYKENDDKRMLELKKLQALYEILDYIKSFSWLSHQSSKEKVKTFLKCNYNYRKASEILGIPLHSLETSICYASKSLERKLGQNTIELILDGDINSAMLQFKVGTNSISISNLFCEGIIDMLPKPKKDNTLSLHDCANEIKFLNHITKLSLQKIIKSMDRAKLSYLLYLLTSSDAQYAYERNLLYKYINDDIKNIDDIAEKKNIYMQ